MNYISLGYFCSIASELEKLGLRTESSPFDWVISDFKGVIMALENHFSEYLDYNFLSQNIENHAVYMNVKYNISFYHDFDKYVSLEKQLSKVQEKYNRRINKFYESISNPTLFIRYISDEETINGVSKELLYIEENYDQILKLLKSFNEFNEILFIANKGVLSTKFTVYNVLKDNNDTVARNPICKNSVLYKKFSNEEMPDKQRNINRYIKKEKYKKSIYCRVKRKIIAMSKRVCLKEYIHTKQYHDISKSTNIMKT